MPLTKARPPVTAISQMANTTTVIDIPTAASDINIDVAGLDVIDIGSTTITVDDLVTLVANTITSEDFIASTAAGAALQLLTNGTEGGLRTTSAHPMVLGANALDNLTAETTGRVTLGTVGTLAAELVDKNYVDTEITSAGAGANTALLAAEGYCRFPTTTGDEFVVQWGKENLVTINGSTVITLPYTYPNAQFGAFVENEQDGMGAKEATAQVSSLTTSAFTLFHAGGDGSLNRDYYWISIGY